MVTTRGGSADSGSGVPDPINAKLEAIVAKLETIDTLKAVIAALKARDKSRGSRFEEGEGSNNRFHQFRPHNKIDFPTFNGGDPRGWLLKAEKYFRYYQIPEDDKVEVASMHLEGDALDLYSWLSTDQPLLLWEDLVQAINKNFGPAEFQNPDEFLCNVKQTGTVQEYRQEFAKRSARVSNWPEHCLLGVFLNGLKDELKSDVRIHKPRTVYNAMSLAIEFEAKCNQGREKYRLDKLANTKPITEEPKSTPVPALPNNNQKPQPRLSDTEKQSRFSRGECFRCGEKYGPGHRCKTSSLQLLEADNRNSDEFVEGDEGVEEAAEISLHAILGMPRHSTLIVPGYINSSKIVDLATLTGACVVALGPSIAGVFTPSDDLAKEVAAASEVAGEKLWRMPMEESYWEMMKSGVADMVNTGGRQGGSILAALFLKQFVDEKVQWLHIDMAGPVWDDKKKGATGFAVSTLVEWVACNSST